jgi:hypothetical protein
MFRPFVVSLSNHDGRICPLILRQAQDEPARVRTNLEGDE